MSNTLARADLGLDTEVVESLSLLQKCGWEASFFPPHRLSFVLCLSSSCCALMTAQGGEELESDSRERLPSLFRTDLSPSLLLLLHSFCHLFLFPSSTPSPAPNPSLKPSPPLPFVPVLLAFSVSEELNKPLWRQTQVAAFPFIPWLGY